MAQVTIDVYGELMSFERGPMHEVTQDEYVIRAGKNHGWKYTYGIYRGMHKPIDAKCPEHGWFTINRAGNHLHRNGDFSYSGCPICYQKWLLERLHGYSDDKSVQAKKSATQRRNLEKKFGMPVDEYIKKRKREAARRYTAMRRKDD